MENDKSLKRRQESDSSSNPIITSHPNNNNSESIEGTNMKKKKKLKKIKVIPSHVQSVLASEERLSFLQSNLLVYLREWQSRESRSCGWKFNKNLQTELIDFCLHESVLCKDSFKTLFLPYAASIQGQAKERLLQVAQVAVDKHVEMTQGPKPDPTSATGIANEAMQAEEKILEKKAKRGEKILRLIN